MAYVSLLVTNCIIMNSREYGIYKKSALWKYGEGSMWLENIAFYNNTSGNMSPNVSPFEGGANIIELSVDPCNDVGNLDFSLNNTSNGGAECRSASINPGSHLSLNNYSDLGAVQSQSTPGSGGTKLRVI